MSFEKEIMIERKNSAEELSICLTKTRSRFEDEFIKANKAKKYLVIENCSYEDIVTGNYDSQYNSKAFQRFQSFPYHQYPKPSPLNKMESLIHHKKKPKYNNFFVIFQSSFYQSLRIQ